MKILLIGPRSEDDVYGQLLRDIPYIKHMTKGKTGAFVAPNALATVAALTPSEHEVHIHDEQVRGPVETILEKSYYDIIGISMLTNQLKRTLNIAEYCKKNKLPAMVAVGGAGTANIPPGFNKLVDVIFFGEAEDTWPQFLKDFKEGNHKLLYHQISKPDASKFPIPRWDIIREDLPLYGGGAVQTSRGCPFDCAFCDVVYIYGRKIRTKSVKQILEEVRILESMGVIFILITDDNFCSNRRHVKELLRELVKLNNSFKIPIKFITQVDITIATDEELLQLMADCGIMHVLIGIESSSEDSLKDLDKFHSTGRNLPEAVKKIQSYGIIVSASMIIGADSDDKSAFKRTIDFIKEANITDHNCHPLMAPWGTKLWYQMKREGRLLKNLGDEWVDKMDVMTNIIPKGMTRIELFEGLADYWETVSDPLHYMERAVSFIKGVKHKPNVKEPNFFSMLPYFKTMFRMLWYYLFQVTPDHRKAFFTIFKTVRKVAPYMGPHMMFLHTCYTVNYKRTFLTTKLARERAAWERAHPEKLTSIDESLPIPLKVRESSEDIFAAAYTRVRKKVQDRETLYKLVIEVMVDYIDRFGESFERLDDYHLHCLNESCDRILAHIPPFKPSETPDLPEECPPSGFEREMLDALDHAIRIRECVTV
jgi:radical SAM superfamily enzyme YgiQ (UPF0313 family)